MPLFPPTPRGCSAPDTYHQRGGDIIHPCGSKWPPPQKKKKRQGRVLLGGRSFKALELTSRGQKVAVGESADRAIRHPLSPCFTPPIETTQPMDFYGGAAHTLFPGWLNVKLKANLLHQRGIMDGTSFKSSVFSPKTADVASMRPTLGSDTRLGNPAPDASMWMSK